jgi:hypothetical protein
MKTRTLLLVACTLSLLAMIGCAAQQPQQQPVQQVKQYKWEVHDKSRPLPPIVTPGPTAADPPSDAVVLFNGDDLSNWESTKGGPSEWKVENGYMEITRRTGGLRSKQAFGSCQLHIEWATPDIVKGEGQGRGNSGVFPMRLYEVQVLDSYENTTYADGQAASFYGQSPPAVNACRPPGQWQTYDIIFHRPIFDGNDVVKPATITVLHNGVLVQDNFEIEGPAVHKRRPKYVPHADKEPIILQDHGNPVRYRNIWIRELPDCKQD